MKVTLINPGSSSKAEVSSVLALKAPPLGLAFLAAVLERAGHSVSIVDAEVMDLTFSQLRHRIEGEQPDMVGVTSTTPAIHDALECVKAVKKASPHTVSVLGGPTCDVSAS
ncbi:hypothetical protein GWN63_01155 [Candidatus Bathyarchaeota archaeon]|nr:cobalamin B12-binding domain-containing protein [Candidatus Bathyarchaeota archaeon]NIU80846.1 hypothetical protein [Candidatus Bathyarchaeota archaeon]NIV67478.1 hypothetical protein [Candidatus Bathyarchaeota archaeon]NIW16133.1 hypothetical protein [Candidatus Bathyarchaeota archaeon]NIW34124.1 hypothetical protein [Candidatus Bathyarchaeota archaeon]